MAEFSAFERWQQRHPLVAMAVGFCVFVIPFLYMVAATLMFVGSGAEITPWPFGY